MPNRSRLLSNKQRHYLETGGPPFSPHIPFWGTHHLLQFSSDHSVLIVGGKNAGITLNKGTRVTRLYIRNLYALNPKVCHKQYELYSKPLQESVNPHMHDTYRTWALNYRHLSADTKAELTERSRRYGVEVTEVCRKADVFNFANPLKTNGKVLSYPMLPDFRKSIAVWKVPRLRPFALLVRAARRWRWVTCIGGMLLQRKPRFKTVNFI